MRAFLQAFVVLLAIGALVGAVAAFSLARRGLSTQVEPTAVEEIVARSMRRLATPAAVRDAANPVEPTEDVLEEGLAHFADHCASCHGNDGSGDTQIGRSLYPRAPDMRAARTQALTDGELFWIIEHGIRLTGMPGWSTGTPEGERASWGLVHFVRRLPDLSDEEVGRMEALNPRTAAEWREEEEIRRFLAGEDVASPSSPRAHDESQH